MKTPGYIEKPLKEYIGGMKCEMNNKTDMLVT